MWWSGLYSVCIYEVRAGGAGKRETSRNKRQRMSQASGEFNIWLFALLSSEEQFQHAKDAASIYMPPPPCLRDKTPQQPQTMICCLGDSFCSRSPRYPAGKHINEKTERGRGGGGGCVWLIRGREKWDGGEEQERRDEKRGGLMEWEKKSLTKKEAETDPVNREEARTKHKQWTSMKLV